MRLAGNARALLTAERSALNTVQHLSGIATMTRAYVDAIAGTGATLLDTRKTIPGLRLLEKYATRMGGATNHRMGLWDAAMIKDNHVAVAGSVGEAVRRAVAAGIERIIVEVDRVDQIEPALAAGATHLLLDNMDVADAARRGDAGRRARADRGVGRRPARHDPRDRRDRRHLYQRRAADPIGARRRYRARFRADGLTSCGLNRGTCMRPKSIVLLRICFYLGSVVLCIVATVMSWGANTSAPTMRSRSGAMFGASFLPIVYRVRATRCRCCSGISPRASPIVVAQMGGDRAGSRCR